MEWPIVASPARPRICCARTTGSDRSCPREVPPMISRRRGHVSRLGAGAIAIFAVGAVALPLTPGHGQDATPPQTPVSDGAVPSWAKVSAAQTAEATRLKVPVAFENSIGMRLVLIPAGTFQMGSPAGEAEREDDETQHAVTISKPYYL